MRLKILLLIFGSALIFSCSYNSKSRFNPILNGDQLASQLFIINVNVDTTLLTKNGCVVKIPKGSLESDSTIVKLEIKEALSTTDIVLAGLTTMSGSNSLRSAGMIYFNAAEGYRVSIKKEIEVLVPTVSYEPNMQVYKGTDSAGKINWTAPTALPQDSMLANIADGDALFKANCANCHKIYDDYTGPGLKGISKKVKKQWIYDFIHNPFGMTDPYSVQLKNKWKPTIMTAFPVLDNKAIDAILAFIETTNNHLPNDPYNDGELSKRDGLDSSCMDSCRRYYNRVDYLEAERNALLKNNGDYFTLERSIPVPPVSTNEIINTPLDTSNIDQPQTKTIIVEKATAVFYTININTVGWYNIDILLKEISECIPSELFVNLQTAYKTTYSVSLIIPSVKAFIEGGKLERDNQYGFDEINGNIPLPQNRQCYIIATAETNGKLLFGKTAFRSGQTQTIDVRIKERNKEDIIKDIKNMNLDDVDLEIKNAPNAQKIKIIEKKAADAEKLKPKNCDCGWPSADSLKNVSIPVALAK